jgi:hypothetical protein
VAAKLLTPPAGVTNLDTGLAGVLLDGPSTLEGVVVVHTGLISDAVGAAGLPGIWGGRATARAGFSKANPAASTMIMAATARVAPRFAPASCAVAPTRSIESNRPMHG